MDVGVDGPVCGVASSRACVVDSERVAANAGVATGRTIDREPSTRRDIWTDGWSAIGQLVCACADACGFEAMVVAKGNPSQPARARATSGALSPTASSWLHKKPQKDQL